MSIKRVAAVIFEGGRPVSQIEKDMVSVRQAIVCDNIAKFKKVEEIDPIIVVTNYPDLQKQALQMGAIVDFSDREFHFGKRLANIIDKYNLTHVFYMGGASAPLITVEEISQFSRQVLAEEKIVLTNNVQSADLVVFSPAKAIHQIEDLPHDDNPLANCLRDVGLHKVLMPHSVGIHFDIDTPTDMLILSIQPRAGLYTKRALDKLQLDVSHLINAKHYLTLPYADVLLSGRVGSPVMTQLNTYIRCRLRVYSEERGMKSLGRDSAGLVESLIGYLIDSVGVANFFSYLAKIAHVAFIDSRVIFAHRKLHVSDNDRFYSDLMIPEKIGNEQVRAFTIAAKEAPLPVMLGGHSLISGGMWALIDAVRYEREQPYSPYKMYRLMVDDKRWQGKKLGQCSTALALTEKIYGVTKPIEHGRRNYFTNVNPQQDVVLYVGDIIHIPAAKEKIQYMENNGFILLH